MLQNFYWDIIFTLVILLSITGERMQELFTLTPQFQIIILMFTNPLLQAKNEAQMRLDTEANHDLKQYVENSYRKVAELTRKYGFTIRYGGQKKQ